MQLWLTETLSQRMRIWKRLQRQLRRLLYNREEELVAVAEGDQQGPGYFIDSTLENIKEGDQDELITYGLTEYLAIKP
jgi:hypothetical protein